MDELKPKNPLQEATQKELDEMQASVSAKPGDQPVTPIKRGRGRPPGSKTTQTQTAPQEQPQAAPLMNRADFEAQAEMLLGILHMIRSEMLGIAKPIQAPAALVFKQSAPDVLMKYGGTIGAYMPEILFSASLLMIGMDTFTEYKRVALEAAKKRHEEALKAAPKPAEEQTAGSVTPPPPPPGTEFRPTPAPAPKPLKNVVKNPKPEK